MQDLKRLSASLPSARDRDFFQRVHAVEEQVYARRVEALGFVGLGKVLDAGCGFGQWTAALARRNATVHAVDLDTHRVEAARGVLQAKGCDNVSVSRGDVSALPFDPESFDAVFSYSVIYYTDPQTTLREWARLLRPGGLLYFSTNAVGWYLYNALTNHNASKDFSPRRMGLAALGRTLRNTLGARVPGEAAMPPATTRGLLRRLGFDILGLGPDGTLGRQDPASPVRPFYPATRYGLTNVYEVLCRKKENPQ